MIEGDLVVQFFAFVSKSTAHTGLYLTTSQLIPVVNRGICDYYYIMWLSIHSQFYLFCEYYCQMSQAAVVVLSFPNL